MEGSAVYLSFARLGASRPPQDVQVETHLSQVGGASLSRSRGRANGTENPVGCHPWRENEEGVKIIPAQNYAGVDTTQERVNVNQKREALHAAKSSSRHQSASGG